MAPSDPRSLGHLEELLLNIPGLGAEILDLYKRLELCRAAVKAARFDPPQNILQ